MSMSPSNSHSFRFVTLRAGGQTYAIAASALVRPLGSCATGPVTPETPVGATGTFVIDKETLPVFRLSEWMGTRELRETSPVQSVLVQSNQGRLILQAREVSAPRELPDGNYLSLPTPLDRLVGERYLAILKWTLIAEAFREKQLSERISTWKAKRVEQQDELFLLINPNHFLQRSVCDDPISDSQVAQPEDQIKVDNPPGTAIQHTTAQNAGAASAGTKRLVLFSPTPDALGDRPYRFGISASQVMEVCRPLPIVPVPGATRSVVGVVNWRSKVVPVLRMAEMVGLEGIRTSQAQRLVIALAPNGRDLVGVQVLATMRSQDLPITNTPHTLPIGEASRYLYGSYELEHETLVMPNLKSMIQFATAE